jgi:2-dehydropantoate 2-reductase
VKVYIIGAGALGSTIGGTLAEAGNEVVLVDPYRAHTDAINRKGLILRSDGKDRTVPVRAAADTGGLGIADLVMVLVKSYHTREAAEAAKNVVGPATSVMSLQNGLSHEEILAEVFGRQHMIAGKTYVGGVMLGPGHVIAGTGGKETIIGELDGSLSGRVAAIADTFGRAGLPVVVSRNIMGAMWDKLLVNVATGALSGITRLTYGDLYAIPAIETCSIAAIAEAMEVARAKGIDLTTVEPREAWLKAADGLPREFKTSMLQSLENGSPTEIDFINGAVVRAGRQAGVATPVNAALVACIKGIECAMTKEAARPASAAAPRVGGS